MTLLDFEEIGRSVVRRPIPPFPPHAPGAVALSRPVWAALALILGSGLALRFLAARGELWLDEMWSLALVAPLHAAGEVFWGISHDNNHFLNSLWLYEAGPDRAPVVYRLPAIVFGGLSILVAARIGLRRGAATGIAAALLAAGSFTLVNYGSEARGYAGLVLAILVAIDAFERAMDTLPLCRAGPDLDHDDLTSKKCGVGRRPTGSAGVQRWALALAIGLGALSHLTMVFTPVVLLATATARLAAPGRSVRAIVANVIWLFWPSGLALAPVGAALLAGILARGGLTMGGAEPFSVARLIAGYAGVLRFTLGLPEWIPGSTVLGIVCLGWRLAVKSTIIGPERRLMLACALLLPPGIMLAGRMPNLEYPRYSLTSGVVLLICLAEAFGQLWSRAAGWRVAGVALLTAILAGQGAPIATLLVHGRGAYRDALVHMGRDGSTTYASDAPFATKTVVDHLTPRLGLSATLTGTGDCARRPDWVIVTSPFGPDPRPGLDVGPADCVARYRRDSEFPTSELSGLAWTLYRRG